MHSYNTRFQAKKAQTEFQAPHITVMDSRRHRYDTRFEINRIRNAIIQRDQDLVLRRDCTAMKDLIAKVEAGPKMKDKIVACIDMFTYLRDHRMLFRMLHFKETILKKIDKIELDCYEHFMSFDRDGRKNVCQLVTIMHDLDFLRKSPQKYQ